MHNLEVRDFKKIEGKLLLSVVDRSIPNEFEHGEPIEMTIKIPHPDFWFLTRVEQLNFLTNQINTEL